MDLIRKAEIQRAFTSAEEMTVFAFNNTAFDILPSERKTAIRQKNARQTEDFVKFHTGKTNNIFFVIKISNSNNHSFSFFF